MVEVLYEQEIKELNGKKVKNLAFRVYITLRQRGFNFLKRVFCFVGQNTLAEELGVSIRAIQNALNELVSLGLIKKIRRGLTKVNIYIFPLLEKIYSIFKSDKEYIEEVEGIEKGNKTDISTVVKKVKNTVKETYAHFTGKNKKKVNIQSEYDMKALADLTRGKISYDEYVKRQNESPFQGE